MLFNIHSVGKYLRRELVSNFLGKLTFLGKFETEEMFSSQVSFFFCPSFWEIQDVQYFSLGLSVVFGVVDRKQEEGFSDSFCLML